MIKYKIQSGFKVITHSGATVLLVDTEYQKNVILSLVDNNSVSQSKQIFDLWPISELTAIGISKIDDPGFDENQYDLTGTPTNTVQGDGSYLRDYSGALTEKSGYIETLRSQRVSECKSSYVSKIDEGYTFDDQVGPPVLNIKLKVDDKSVRSFRESAENIANGNNFALKIKDYDGLINDTASSSQLTSISNELTNYKGKMLDKKFEHLKTIEGADRTSLDSMTSFDWTI